VLAFLHALRDSRTFDLRANPGLWLGFLLALPIPIVSLSSTNPAWVDVVSLTAPVVWAVFLGAAGRVAGLHRDQTERVTAAAAEASLTHSSECEELRGSVAAERRHSQHLASEQLSADTELVLAQSVHRSLFPEEIHRADVNVAVRQIPCARIGGDYLQAVFARDDLLYLCVGDVSGHGVAAALVVSRIHALVLRLIFEQRTPQQFLEEINRAAVNVFAHTSCGFFLTLGVFRVDLAARRIDYATAGHPAQLLVRHDGRIESLTSGNGLLGMSQDVLGPLHATSTLYGPGDSLVLFTDGLFEVSARDGGDILGEPGLRSMVERFRGNPAAVVAGVLQAVANLKRPGPFEDDVSLMVAELGPTGPGSAARH
jgi:sigma-B regulation protein RsbU (phosphoserine phosphatase)